MVEKNAAKNADVSVPALGPLGMLRWAWTQLTSMRTALFLLLLLAVAAVPGSLFPQRSVNPEQVNQYLANNPGAGEWLDRFQLFDVYSSVWFSAIYLLLFISLIGCVIPRARKHAKALRTPPPRTPARLSRLPEHGTVPLPAEHDGGPSGAAVVQRAAELLRKRGYRVEARPEGPAPSVAAERGYLREIGNLVFHVSLIGVLGSVAVGGMFGYGGQRLLVEGESFVNTLVSYDSFSPGTNFSEESLVPFSIRLDRFEVEFDRESKTHFGQPIDFTASVTTTDTPGAEAQQKQLKVNHPVRIGGTAVYLVGNGYAPVVTVRDGNGDIAFQGPVIGVPQDAAYTSLVVIKVPDARPDQLGFVGFFLPTAVIGEDGVSFSADPSATIPQLNLNSYYGDLGLDAGDPQNVYVLDPSTLTELNSRNLDAGGIVLDAGTSYDLPEGKGSVSFDGLKRYVALDIRHDPGKVPVAVFSALALMGLGISLFVPRRRAWIKVVEAGARSGGTQSDGTGERIIEYGLLARGEDPRLVAEAAELRTLLEREWPGMVRERV
ncbi:cytochrome c biogenesis protein ResB [Zafaria cholistanensis]|uniref:Cytochrome c biogenesis protein ResB n=1 Tax=Zafaria cholistanensis TaxID=1682741 RepID=A0A5A7NRM7_9MICC|nr:cytochrome c biogenesis protein ResB [Zafaria cholistanensis]GER22471.1 cytochrome c biogenesis protein ResB [Zafaria cholistanensis]